MSFRASPSTAFPLQKTIKTGGEERCKYDKLIHSRSYDGRLSPLVKFQRAQVVNIECAQTPATPNEAQSAVSAPPDFSMHSFIDRGKAIR
jgi:hypothetical protein